MGNILSTASFNLSAICYITSNWIFDFFYQSWNKQPPQQTWIFQETPWIARPVAGMKACHTNGQMDKIGFVEFCHKIQLPGSSNWPKLAVLSDLFQGLLWPPFGGSSKSLGRRWICTFSLVFIQFGFGILIWKVPMGSERLVLKHLRSSSGWCILLC